MVKKRELTVEKWCAHELKFSDEVANNTDVLMSMDPDDVDGILGEILMAKGFHECGMQVYEFDPDFAESILDEKWAELLPEVIDYIPHYCFYIKLPFNSLSEGSVVSLSEMDELVNGYMYDYSFADNGPGVYPMPGHDMSTIVNTGERMVHLGGFAIPKDFSMMLDDTPLGTYPRDLFVNAVAYLCSANADIAAVYSPKKEKRKNNGKKRSLATWHEVGYRIGAELRNYMRTVSERSKKTGRTVRPHMRRAHWHRYWIGPHDGERRLVLKWVAPTMVGVGIESATGHKVR